MRSIRYGCWAADAMNRCLEFIYQYECCLTRQFVYIPILSVRFIPTYGDIYSIKYWSIVQCCPHLKHYFTNRIYWISHSHNTIPKNPPNFQSVLYLEILSPRECNCHGTFLFRLRKYFCYMICSSTVMLMSACNNLRCFHPVRRYISLKTDGSRCFVHIIIYVVWLTVIR